MAWVTPVTDRLNGNALMTATDMDRITGNIDYLFTFATNKGHTPAGTTVTQTSWAINDIIDVTFWTNMLTTLSNICDVVGYIPQEAPDSSMTYTNINNIESISLLLYNVIDNIENLYRQNHWAGDDLYAGDGIYAGGDY